MNGLFEALDGVAGYRDLLLALSGSDGAPTVEASPPPGARPFLIAALWRRLGVPVLLVTPRAEDARRLYDQLLAYLGDDAPVHLLPEPEVLPFERLVADAGASGQRLRALWSLAEASQGGPAPLMVASVAALLRKTLAVDTFRSATQTLAVGQRVSLDALLSNLARLGYSPDEGVEVPGTFSRRGGIVDIFSPSSTLPFRLELWGDAIDSIRRFEPASQRSVERVERASIVPAREVLPALADREEVSRRIGALHLGSCLQEARERIQEELTLLFSDSAGEELPFYSGLFNHASLLEHLPPGSVAVLERPADVHAEAEAMSSQEDELRASREGRGDLPRNFPSPQLRWSELEAALAGRPQLHLGGWASDGPESISLRPAPSYYGRVDAFVSAARAAAAQRKRLVAVSRHARRLHELFEEAGVPAVLTQSLDALPGQGHVTVVNGSLREGFVLATADSELLLFSDGEVFGTAKERGPRRARTTVRHAPFLSELTPGSYVVHIDHGVARFAGTTHMGGQDGQREYLVLEYAEGDKIYVPTDHLDRVSPYVAPSDQAPTLTRLGGGDWARTKERVKASAREMAQELLKLYAARAHTTGRAFGPDTAWQSELEESFPYEETADQARAIAEVKLDMEAPRPMDRLVCGDVGYGKTEVALRAAFKAVADGTQVAMLVPTTVLAQQHYATFAERLKPFPVTVEVLSRFRSDAEQEQVVEALKQGKVDIVIGTHRLIQKDVGFKNLGLVIVDEEQRFGVAHKERLKQMRAQVDVLTLSATPIPRTLYMALSGIRDMSTMETPPEERLPIKTYVGEYSPDLAKEAILRELERGGQVFFLHNRVRSIRSAAAEVQALAPQASIAVGHGRMNEQELEEVMDSFARGEVDVLVCTTIIESGLDVPNANTLVIDRADRLGLSQLYQLRGRVGRSSQRAYSYLFVPRGRKTT
ncbi:MAG: transcription-repair coupling factor, partial [Chloroflexota bacterium]|nr:transcription-repair coupling factor [Chloroflexota bacterium]